METIYDICVMMVKSTFEWWIPITLGIIFADLAMTDKAFLKGRLFTSNAWSDVRVTTLTGSVSAINIEFILPLVRLLVEV